MAATDRAIGRFRARLDSLGLSASIIVIVTADNGAHDNTFKQYGHSPHMAWRGEKADIFEAGHRVPFFVKWPGVAKANATTAETICLTDFMATAAAIASIRLPDGAGEDSYSLLPIRLGRNLAAPLREATVHHSINGTFGIRQGNWKLVLDNMGSGGFTAPDSVAGPGTLYDLAANPGEDTTKDQYATKPTLVKNLRALLAKYKADGRSTALPRHDEFWQEPSRVPWQARDASGYRLSGSRVVFAGASDGDFTATFSGLDGRRA